MEQLQQRGSGSITDLPGRRLSRKEAAIYLGLSEQWLTDLAFRQQGPRFYKLGRRCLYTVEDLDAWFNANATTRAPKAA